MALPAGRFYLLLFLFVVAPIGAVVVISALLLFGVTPHVVFAPGFGIKSLLEACGLHVPNRIAVAGTAFCWWAVIASIGLIWEWRRQLDNRQPTTKLQFLDHLAENEPFVFLAPKRAEGDGFGGAVLRQAGVEIAKSRLLLGEGLGGQVAFHAEEALEAAVGNPERTIEVVAARVPLGDEDLVVVRAVLGHAEHELGAEWA